MATGYDSRQSGKDTFAFQPQAPVQGSSGPVNSGGRGAQVVGGESHGGVVNGGNLTNPGSIGAGLGAFFEEAMAPYVQARQNEKFFEGFQKAQEGIALDELDHSTSLSSKLFGPSAFESGAGAYTAQKAISDFQTTMVTDTDRLKKMAPADVAKEVSAKSVGMMTGHPVADQLIQQGLIAASGPVLNTVAKARDIWQQEELGRQQADTWASGATALQAIGVAQAGLTDPDATQRSATSAAVASFRTMMQPLDGQHDENYRKGLYNFQRKAMQDGNFYAVEVMRAAGVDDVFDDDQKTKLEDAYQKYGNKVQAKAVSQPDILLRLITLDTNVKKETVPGGPLGAASELVAINTLIRQRTGVDIDLFDADDLRKTAGGVTDVIVASMRRLEARGWAIEDRDAQINATREDKAAERAEVAAQVQTVWGMGTIEEGMAGGLKSGDFDVLALNDYHAGNYKNITNAYARSGWVSSAAANVMQSRVTSSLGDQYTKDTAIAYKEWSQLNTARPAAAAAYYGTHHLAFQKFDSLKRGGMTDQQAYKRSFGDPSIYGEADIPAERKKEVKEQVASHVSGLGTSWYNPMSWGNYNLNASSQATVTAQIARSVGIAAKNSDLPTEELTKQAIETARANGSLEQVGSFAWTNKPGTKPLSQLLKVQQAEADEVFTTVLDDRLKAAGFPDGAGGDNYDIIRLNGPDGQPMLHVRALGDSTSESRDVLISLKELQASAKSKIGKEVRGNPPGRRPTAPQRYPGLPGPQ